MRFIGFKSAMLAAGLMLAGVGHAAPQTVPVGAPASTTPAATVPASQPAPAVAPTPVATPTPAADSAMLATDGAPTIAIDPKIGQPVDGEIGLQPQVTKNGVQAAWMHNVILVPVITAISLLVLFLLLWVVARYNRRANPVASKTAHNTTIEVIWTLVPVLILVLIAIPSIGLLQAQFKPAPKNAITLKATGNQWYWTYAYPDNGGFEVTSNILKEKDEVSGNERARTDADGPRLLAVDNRVVLPVGVPIRLITTAADVIHSWAVPAFWIKLDAVPGRLNETSFTIEKPGLYFGQCSELCGPRHGYMPIAVEAVPLDVFNRWVVAKGGTVAGGKPAVAVPDTDAVSNTTGPVVNATVAPPTINQPAAGSSASASTSGH
ncbi:cytochrome c oxidase subunit II [Sphingomonas sp.]|jgi:cytochrome c oxidase subunit 2|uniref:cytochrome c oxidase subunit II n=1 Tax=Sphingomonas sp. TaxID=28214 RepID=UPI002E37B9D6|nr:cytochrome c oxidase subunit II [Sphingomonas sp.]HEX4694246.1 cytochrome c oxidase subunit II [Sphingomonas sp.]